VTFESTDNVTTFPVQPKLHDKTIALAADRWSGCPHKRAVVDPKLAELTCADCNAKLNPVEFLVMLANQSNAWDFELKRIETARAELAARKVCRCTRCGQMTPVDHVPHRMAKKIKARAAHQQEIT
jgi:hypothetical protein